MPRSSFLPPGDCKAKRGAILIAPDMQQKLLRLFEQNVADISIGFDEYVRDPLCSYTFTLGAYYQMFAGMKVLVRKGSMKRIPKTLPVLFTAGSDDPVGAFGKNVIRVYEKYKDAGIKDVSIHLYKGDRHEILNEVDRQNVYQDILAWIEEKNRR